MSRNDQRKQQKKLAIYRVLVLILPLTENYVEQNTKQSQSRLRLLAAVQNETANFMVGLAEAHEWACLKASFQSYQYPF